MFTVAAIGFLLLFSPSHAMATQSMSPSVDPLFFSPAQYIAYSKHDTLFANATVRYVDGREKRDIYGVRALGLFKLVEDRFNLGLAPEGRFGRVPTANQFQVAVVSSAAVTESVVYGMSVKHFDHGSVVTHGLMYRQDMFTVGGSFSQASVDNGTPNVAQLHGLLNLGGWSFGGAYEQQSHDDLAFEPVIIWQLGARASIRDGSTAALGFKNYEGKVDEIRVSWEERLNNELAVDLAIRRYRTYYYKLTWTQDVTLGIRKEL